MAILTQPSEETPKEPRKETPKGPVITHEKYKSATVDTKYTPQRSLLTHIEGSPWKVLYYQQALASSDELTPQQMGKDAVYQQYIEIADLEIRVTDALSQQQDSESNWMSVTGSATLYPPMIPNVGDMFLGDIGDGREGVFSILSTNRLTILKESCYQIEYTLVDYSTPQRRADFSKKTIKRTHFVKRLLEHGEDPIIVNEDYHQYLSLGEYQSSLTSKFFGEFYSRSAATLSVPDQSVLTYDPFVVKAVQSFMDTHDHPRLQHVKSYSVEIPDRDFPITLWDCLLRFSDDLLPMISERLSIVGSQCFGVVPQYQSVYFSNVVNVVYPVDGNGFVHPTAELVPGGFSAKDVQHHLKRQDLGSLSDLGKRRDIDTEALPSIHPVTLDSFYVLSEAFYRDQKESQSRLERLVRHALEGTPIDQRVLSELCQQSDKWGRLERFYYIPILLILLKMTRRGS